MQRKGGVSHAQWRLEALLGSTVCFAAGAGAAGGRHSAAVPSAAAHPAAAGCPQRERCAHPAAQDHRPAHRASVRLQRTARLCAGLPERQPELRASAQRACRAHRAFCRRRNIPCPLLCRRWPGPLPRSAGTGAGPAGGHKVSGLFSRCAGAHCQPVRAGAGGLYRRTDRGRACPPWPQPGRAGHFRRGRARILVPAAGRRSLFTSTHRSGPRCRVGCFSPAGSGPAARHPAGCLACQQFGPAHRPDRAGL